MVTARYWQTFVQHEARFETVADAVAFLVDGEIDGSLSAIEVRDGDTVLPTAEYQRLAQRIRLALGEP